MRKFKFGKISAALVLASLQAISLAEGGGASGVGGGGDLCEDRIKIVRDDIEQWIKLGGHKGLRLPGRIPAQKYAAQMSAAIKSAKIKCVGEGDKGYPVQFNGTPKTCRFDKNLNTGTSQITCDFVKFQSIDESNQYVLVHHEYAGIASLEVPVKEDSNYYISNQITGYLADQVVKRLTVSRAVAVKNNKNGTVIDRELFAWLKHQYDGDLVLGSNEAGGKITAEVLKDQSVLVEMTDSAAGIMFTGITKGAEDFYYWPGTTNGSSYNYYRRTGSSFHCRMISNDLKEDPFRRYKCRFTVDAKGNVASFYARNESNSLANFSVYSDSPEQKADREFLWRSPETLAGDSRASMNFGMRAYYFQSQKENDPSVEIDLYGDVAKKIYESLESTATKAEFLGLVKYGNAIRCNYDADADQWCKFACRIRMNFHGAALPKEIE